MDKLLLWLDGKKTYINSLALIIVPLLVSTGTLTAQWGAAITAIIGILTGYGKYVTDNAVANNTDLGTAILTKRAK